MTDSTESPDTAIVLSPDDLRRHDWLAGRRTCVTGTDVAKILGLSRFGGPIDVYLDKTGQSLEGNGDAEPLKWGRRAEPMILTAYGEEVAPLLIEQPFTLRRSTAHPLVGATLDARRWSRTDGPAMAEGTLAELADGRPVDAKNVRHSTADWGDSGTDQMPLYYATQLVIQMHVTDAPYADLAVLFSGSDFRVYTLERDRELEDSLIDRCEKFWTNHVLTLQPPPADSSKAYTEYLKKKFAKHSDIMIAATPDQEPLGALLQAAREQYDIAEHAKDAIENRLKEAIGEARGIEGKTWRATWAKSKDSTGTDWKAIARDLALEWAQLSGKPATVMFDKMAKDKKYEVVTKKGSRRFLPTFDQE